MVKLKANVNRYLMDISCKTKGLISRIEIRLFYKFYCWSILSTLLAILEVPAFQRKTFLAEIILGPFVATHTNTYDHSNKRNVVDSYVFFDVPLQSEVLRASD